MYSVPDSFNRQLFAEWGDMLRIRYSTKTHSFHVEQKIGRAVLPPNFVNSEDDDAIRARDGYGFVMSFTPGDRMACPIDGTALKVPHLKTGEVRCFTCVKAKRDGRYRGAYFPFNDSLLQHLRSLDPRKGRQFDVVADADRANKLKQMGHERETSNVVESGIKENYGRMVGIPQFGYGGQDYTWIK